MCQVKYVTDRMAVGQMAAMRQYVAHLGVRCHTGQCEPECINMVESTNGRPYDPMRDEYQGG
jgi:hypothetical protein